MKTNGFTVGNLVRGNSRGEYHTLDIDMLKYMYKTKSGYSAVTITEEILVNQCGFEIEDDYLELQISEDLSIVYVGYLALMVNGVIVQINNSNSNKIHQLQNLYFDLSGEKLTIKIK